jgi:hypothetical protein
MTLLQSKANEERFRRTVEAKLPEMLRRAKRVKLQAIIPAHWFAAAASECAGMYVSGHFYGAISVAQAYVEALARYLAESNSLRRVKDPMQLWDRLFDAKIVSRPCVDAARRIFDGRNGFHHLNRDIETDYQALESRAELIVECIHEIESEVFACSISAEPGVVDLKNPRYWPSDTPGIAQVHVRTL